MLLAIYNFNRPRNKFEWNPVNEKDMLSEEIKEFFDATSVAERLDARVDTGYVWEGTKMKAVANAEVLSETFKEGIETAIELFDSILMEELDLNTIEYRGVLAKAMKIVCDANALKPYEKDGKGKVKKNKDTPNATKLIEQMLKRHRAE